MKTFLIALLIIILAISAGVIGLTYWQQQTTKTGQAPIILQQTLVGILEPIPSTGEYSDVVVGSGKTVGVTSNTVNLRPYENKKVKIIGEYSGSTMYADSVIILP